MEISNNFNRYDSSIQPNNVQQNANTQATSKINIKQYTQAYRIELSPKAMESLESNDDSITFPIHDSNILQYNENLDLTYKS